VFTICEAYLVSYFATKYNPLIVFSAVLMTCCVTVGLALYAWATDLTQKAGVIVVLIFAIIGFGIIYGIFDTDLYNDLYTFAGAIIFGLYMVYETD
jgi:FtsH-binding integral membrane protein